MATNELCLQEQHCGEEISKRQLFQEDIIDKFNTTVYMDFSEQWLIPSVSVRRLVHSLFIANILHGKHLAYCVTH